MARGEKGWRSHSIAGRLAQSFLIPTVALPVARHGSSPTLCISTGGWGGKGSQRASWANEPMAPCTGVTMRVYINR